MTFLKAALAGLLAILSPVTSYLAPVAGSIRGVLTPAELARAFGLALGSSTVVGFLSAFVGTIGTDAAANTTAGLGGALVAFVAIHLADLIRRLGQGTPSAPSALASHPESVSAEAEPLLVEHIHTAAGSLITAEDVFSAFEAGLINSDWASALLKRLMLNAPEALKAFNVGLIGQNDAEKHFLLQMED